MADGSEEETVEKSTDELLAETDDLLSDLEGGDERAASDATAEKPTRSESSSDDGSFDLGFGSSSKSTQAAENDERDDGEGWRRYFNPKSFLLATLLLTVGYVSGAFVPVLGGLASWAGLVGAAFLYGLGTSKGRYPETALAGAGIGVVTTVLTNLRFVAFLPNSQWLLAFGGALGLLGGLVGYYFGSDLRKGLMSDPDEFEDDLSW